jgi:hypothetical protein
VRARDIPYKTGPDLCRIIGISESKFSEQVQRLEELKSELRKLKEAHAEEEPYLDTLLSYATVV